MQHHTIPAHERTIHTDATAGFRHPSFLEPIPGYWLGLATSRDGQAVEAERRGDFIKAKEQFALAKEYRERADRAAVTWRPAQ